MSYDFCLNCGVLLSPNVYECPVCGFDNSFTDPAPDYEDDPFLSEMDDILDLDEEF